MKNRFWASLLAFGYVVAMSFLWSGGVSAQTETPTPFPSFTPPPTETPLPTATGTAVGQACPPEGTLEAGIQTQTPSPLWLVECEHCLTPEPTGTVTQTPFPTATHDGTGTPYPTPTINPDDLYCDDDDLPSQTVEAQWVSGSLQWSGNWPWDGCAKSTGIADGRYTFMTWTGTGARLFFEQDVDHGIADIYLDDVYHGEIDTYSASNVCGNLIYEITGLEDVEHTVKIYPTDRKNPSASNDKIGVNSATVESTLADVVDMNINSTLISGYPAADAQYSFECMDWGEIGVTCYYSYGGKNDANTLGRDFRYQVSFSYDDGDGDQDIYVRHVQNSGGFWTWDGVSAFPYSTTYQYQWDIDTVTQINDDADVITVAYGNHQDPTTCDCNYVFTSGQVWFSPLPFECDPALVPPAPPEAGFCAAVNGGDGYGENDVFGFDLFKDDPSASTNCDLGWDEFTFLEYTVPAVEICFQPVLFGVIKMWGEDYEVGIYGLIAAGAAIWRFLAKI